MEHQELIARIKDIKEIFPSNKEQWTERICRSFFLTTLQFIKVYIGENTEFFQSLAIYNGVNIGARPEIKANAAITVLDSVESYLKLNLSIATPGDYNVRIDIINDFISQAIILSQDKKFHPAASAILLGAALEEFLKNIALVNNIDISGIKQTIDPISQKLYENEIITKQDIKDITSWAGLRNDATHGNFEAVNDRKRVQNAIEGVNLFMRKNN